MTHTALLKKALAIHGGSKTDLGKALGVGKQHIYNWVRAERIPPWRLAGVLEIVQKSKDRERK